MPSNKRGLGKGLDALIKAPVKSSYDNHILSEDKSNNKVIEVSLDSIVASPLQPRKNFDETNLEELVNSISQHGIIQPLIVRKVNGKYELIAGERRLRASKKLNLDTVPIIVRESSDKDVLEMAIIENLQREDLDPIEEANAYLKLSTDFHLKQEEIANRVGKKRATVANAMRLLDLSKDVQGFISKKLISTGHGKVILGLKDKQEQSFVSDQIIKNNLTVRDTEKFISQNFNRTNSSSPIKNNVSTQKNSQYNYQIQKIEDVLRSKFSTDISIRHSEKKGKIEINYYGNDDFNRILDLLNIGDL